MMKKLTIITLPALLCMLLFGTTGFGSGFQVPEQGGAAMGMGMGFIGKADDLSAIYHNPAGLTQLQGYQVYFGTAGIAPTATYTRTGYEGEETKNDLIPVPMLAVSTDFNGRFGNIVAAFGVNAPFGLRSEYDELGAQRYISTNIALTTIYAGPYLGWQITPHIAVGGGVQYAYATAEIGQRVNYGGALSSMLDENPDYDGVIDISEATDSGFAGNVGVLVTPTDNLQLGATWRSGLDFDVEGDVSLEIPAAVTQLSGGLMQSLETEGATTVSLPQVLGVGLSYQPIDKLTLIGDFNWINWSVYEDIDFEFDLNTPYFPDKENPRDWDDSIAIRLGAEYWLNNRYAIRAGYIFDQSPIPDDSHGPELPTSDRNNITLGFGMRWDKLSIDIAYAHLFIKDRTVESSIREPQPVGEYECSGNVVGISLAYTF